MPETSVLIRTFNEEKYLLGLLEGIASQDYRDYETVVVDSGSFDRTRDIARPYADKLLRIESADFTFGYSLNVGVTAAEGRFIAIVSAHTKPLDSSWLGELIAPLRDPDTAMCYGRQVGWETSKFGDIQDLGRTFGSSRRVLVPPNFFANNANSAIRKDLWESHEFDEALPGLEDIEWARHWMEQGYVVVYEPRAALYHIHEESWPQVRRRYYREAFAARAMGISGPRRVPVELAKEGKYLLADLYNVAKQGSLRQMMSETVLFRVNKFVGTTRGLVDGKAMADSDKRRALFFDSTTHSVVIRAVAHAAFEESDAPRLKPGEVLVRVAYAGVTPTDVKIYDGAHPSYWDGTATYPIVPGQEVSGIVAACGTNVGDFSEGDRVVVVQIQGCGACLECKRGYSARCTEPEELGVIGRNGGYAHFLAVPSRLVHRVPHGVDLRVAGLAYSLATALKGLNRLSRAWPAMPVAKSCAVVGVGPLGHMCARVLELRGHEVTVFDRNPTRLGYFAGSNIKIAGNTDELGGIDVLVETTGDPDALQDMMVKSMPGAAILLLGVPMAHEQFIFRDLVAYDKTIVGSVGRERADVEEALELLPRLELGPFLQHIVPFDRFAEAWQSVRNDEYLKTLLEIDPELGES